MKHLLLKWSIAALLSSNGADTASSWGQLEANPALGGQFNSKSAAVKFGVLGAVVGLELLQVRKNPNSEKPLAITNFVMAGALTGVAVRNWRVR